ncbi:translation initiation factor [Lithospermum erythrorhizon]|uniref:Translation initiation factor n=1 Tax=Lithospermum erythrorhizon TaxID=34254 RepID=A0AAV3R8H1_LITER
MAKKRGRPPGKRTSSSVNNGEEPPVTTEANPFQCQEVERQSAAIRALRDVEIEQMGTMIQILRSYFNNEQLQIPVLQFFKDNLQNLSIGVTEDGNFHVQSKQDDDNAHMDMDDERNLQSTLFHQISTVYGDRCAAVPSFGGFGFSKETVKTSVFGVENLHISSFDLEDPPNNQPNELQDGLQTPNASNLRLSVGMTPKTLRLPKPGEMLLSVHGSPLGVFNEEKMEAIQESEDC